MAGTWRSGALSTARRRPPNGPYAGQGGGGLICHCVPTAEIHSLGRSSIAPISWPPVRLATLGSASSYQPASCRGSRRRLGGYALKPQRPPFPPQHCCRHTPWRVVTGWRPKARSTCASRFGSGIRQVLVAGHSPELLRCSGRTGKCAPESAGIRCGSLHAHLSGRSVRAACQRIAGRPIDRSPESQTTQALWTGATRIRRP